MSMAKVGKCSVCGKDASINTPYIDLLGTLFCYRCAEQSNEMLIGVSQHLDSNGKYMADSMGFFTKKHCLISTKHGMAAWTEDGLRSYKLTEEEKNIAAVDPEAILDRMIAMREAGKYRCTDCGKEMDEKDVGTFPLFAGGALRGMCRNFCSRRREGKTYWKGM